MNYTDTQLKQALAKMLPKHLIWLAGEENSLCCICRDLTNKVEHYLPAQDTELLHICWMVEENLTPHDRKEYVDAIDKETGYTAWPFTHATWQQRTIALANVKGIEL